MLRPFASFRERSSMPIAAGTWFGARCSINLWACCLSAAMTGLFYTATVHSVFFAVAPPVDSAKKFELESPAPILDEDHEETLAAIDEGIRDGKAGRTFPAEEVRKRLPKGTSAS